VGDSYPRIKVAAVQAAPVFLNREATVEKACRLIREAGASGARVIGFPEGFLPGHPLWFHFFPATGPESQRLSTELFKNAVEIPSAATDALAVATRDAGAYVVLGLCEKRAGTTGTMYNTQIFFDPQGRIMGKHRKLTPTSGERIVHMGGDGGTLRTFDADFGKFSGLICGENSNPLAVFALAAESTMLHIASWPSIGRRGNLSRSDRASMTGRAFAMMTKAFVLNVCGTLSDEMRDMLTYTAEDRTFLDNLAVTGGSSIVGPSSRLIAGPLGGEEGVLYAECDLEECVRQKLMHDMAGHYNRPDVFSLRVSARAPEIYSREADTDAASTPATPETTQTTSSTAPPAEAHIVKSPAKNERTA
jgi:aliphatic nitrilase